MDRLSRNHRLKYHRKDNSRYNIHSHWIFSDRSSSNQCRSPIPCTHPPDCTRCMCHGPPQCRRIAHTSGYRWPRCRCKPCRLCIFRYASRNCNSRARSFHSFFCCRMLCTPGRSDIPRANRLSSSFHRPCRFGCLGSLSLKEQRSRITDQQ